MVSRSATAARDRARSRPPPAKKSCTPLRARLNYSGSKQNICLSYEEQEDKKFPAGTYLIEVYVDGNVAGAGSIRCVKRPPIIERSDAINRSRRFVFIRPENQTDRSGSIIRIIAGPNQSPGIARFFSVPQEDGARSAREIHALFQGIYQCRFFQDDPITEMSQHLFHHGSDHLQVRTR